MRKHKVKSKKNASRAENKMLQAAPHDHDHTPSPTASSFQLRGGSKSKKRFTANVFDLQGPTPMGPNWTFACFQPRMALIAGRKPKKAHKILAARTKIDSRYPAGNIISCPLCYLPTDGVCCWYCFWGFDKRRYTHCWKGCPRCQTGCKKPLWINWDKIKNKQVLFTGETGVFHSWG